MKNILIALSIVGLIACSNTPPQDKITDINATRNMVVGSMKNSVATFILQTKFASNSGLQQSDIQIHIDKFPVVEEFDLCLGAEESFVAKGYIVTQPFTCPSAVSLNAQGLDHYVDGHHAIVNVELNVNVLKSIRIVEDGNDKYVIPVIDLLQYTGSEVITKRTEMSNGVSNLMTIAGTEKIQFANIIIRPANLSQPKP